MLVIGSQAMRWWFPWTREPKDFDVFVRTDEHYDLMVRGDVFSHPDLDYYLPAKGAFVYATPDEQYTIKASHAYWELRNGSWDKHMADMLFLKNSRAKLNFELHDLLRRIWTEKHGQKRVSLEMEDKTFFADAVNRKYDHDSVHATIAYGDEPLYMKILKDGETVAVDPTKLWLMPFEEKILLFREEIYATALERKLIPANYNTSQSAAYRWALRRTITSLTKGRSATFIVDHFDRFARREVDFLARHMERRHLLLPYKKEN